MKLVVNSKPSVFFTHAAVKLCLPSLYLCSWTLNLKAGRYIYPCSILSGWFWPLLPACQELKKHFFFPNQHISCFVQLLVFRDLVVTRPSVSSSRSLITLVCRMGSRLRALWQLLNNSFQVDISQDTLSLTIQLLTHLA